MLKNKYNLMLCQSCLHTASKTFVHHKKKKNRFAFLHFRIRSNFDRKGWRIRKNTYENFGLRMQGLLLFQIPVPAVRNDLMSSMQWRKLASVARDD